MKTTLYPYQTEDVRRMRDWDGIVLNANELGLGKSVETLAYIDRFLPRDPPGPVVIVCPSHLKIHWQREVTKHLGRYAEILSGRKCPAHKLPPVDPNQIYVINYDVLVPTHWPSGSSLPPGSWAKFLADQNPRMIVGDEGHLLKNPSAARSRAFKRMSRKIPHKHLLTGTPLANRPGDMWNLLNILLPEQFRSQHDFCEEFSYARPIPGGSGYYYYGAKRLDQLHRLLGNCVMIRRKKSDVLKDLPPITHTVIPVEIDLKEYRRAEANFLSWLGETGGHPSSAAKAEELTRLTGLKQLAGHLKVKSVVAMVEDILEEGGGKLLLGTIHHAVSDAIARHFKGAAVQADGRHSSTQKQAAFDRFNLDESCRLLVGNLQAAGTGWSCFSTSDVAVCEMPWVSAELEQFGGRCHGFGRGLKGNPTHVRYWVAAGTIEEDVCALLQRKLGWAAEAIDGTTSVGGMDIHTQVVNRIKERQ